MLEKVMRFTRGIPLLPDRLTMALNARHLRQNGIELGAYPWIQSRVDLYLGGRSSMTIGDNVFIPRSVEVIGYDEGRIEIGNGVSIDSGARLHVANNATLRVGDRTGIGPYNFFNAFDDLTIGSDTMFSPMVNVNCADHGMELGSKMREQYGTYGPVSIGSDCWLGAMVVVLKGVTIGDGAVVGAGAVVTGDIPAYSIAVGVPARVVGERK